MLDVLFYIHICCNLKFWKIYNEFKAIFSVRLFK